MNRVCIFRHRFRLCYQYYEMKRDFPSFTFPRPAFRLGTHPLQLGGAQFFPAGKAFGVRHLAQRAKLQCRPSGRDSLYRWNTPCPAALPLPVQLGHWHRVYQLLLPFFSQISSGCRVVPHSGQGIWLIFGSARHAYCST